MREFRRQRQKDLQYGRAIEEIHFSAAHEQSGREWPRTIAFLRSLDRKRLAQDLCRRVAGK